MLPSNFNRLSVVCNLTDYRYGQKCCVFLNNTLLKKGKKVYRTYFAKLNFADIYSAIIPVIIKCSFDIVPFFFLLPPAIVVDVNLNFYFSKPRFLLGFERHTVRRSSAISISAKVMRVIRLCRYSRVDCRRLLRRRHDNGIVNYGVVPVSVVLRDKKKK